MTRRENDYSLQKYESLFLCCRCIQKLVVGLIEKKGGKISGDGGGSESGLKISELIDPTHVSVPSFFYKPILYYKKIIHILRVFPNVFIRLEGF